MINEINEWRENLICQIQKHIDKQKFLVEQEFKIQSNYLQIKHQEFLDTALIYEERKNREEVRQLLEQCHVLRFELSAFDYSEQYIPFIQIKKEQQLIESKPNSFNTHNYEKQSTINDGIRIENNKDAYVSRPSKSANSNRMNQQIVTTTSSMNHSPCGTRNDTQNFRNDMIEKCPVCFMIFPSAMKTYERSQHVNQHFGDS
ncbi:unnamed protein product [Adineta steineri]|uniref:Uncharacterized protein n=1 Tax=Adineta steineri TaxID=433720 RepID=A0A820GIG8_9BILA|nr:unnamed protein product [Adineta steineri]